MRLSLLLFAASASTLVVGQRSKSTRTTAKSSLARSSTSTASAAESSSSITSSRRTRSSDDGSANSVSAKTTSTGSSAPASSSSAAGATSCDVWSKISSTLSGMFSGCNDDSRAAIRAVFHDCFPDGGCDGSLAIAEELNRPINAGLVRTVNKLKALADQNSVPVADMLMFAGSAAVLSCPGGPLVQTFVGRTDASSPAPDGQLPTAEATGDEALQRFKARGFSANDLAALIGSHSTARQFTTDPSKAGASLDSTPSQWDITYYQQTIAKKSPFTLQSDASLANQTEVGPIMKKFSTSKSAWDSSFSPAMAKLEQLGASSGLLDCTSALKKSRSPRDAKSAPINARLY
ncbi:heme peroxidase [Tothia fuscella]|uniref:Peroxidase n=1 Tax=Tothia fuscella TaxID=1048955 RepID=A0A9P4TZH6_9PEZI|nr:heme peroxidase [Tothia fuscella]